jgi:hypothetical protein
MITTSNSPVKGSGIPNQLLDVLLHTIAMSRLSRVRRALVGRYSSQRVAPGTGSQDRHLLGPQGAVKAGAIEVGNGVKHNMFDKPLIDEPDWETFFQRDKKESRCE